jgi:hypothetical protein
MADIEYSGDPGPQQARTEPEPAALGGLVTVVGALTSLLLVIGVGYWGYSLLVRDVSGVPVVRALEGPMRAPPREPGGEAADYQGLAVNEVAAQGGAAPTADRLILAPRPIDLDAEDRPQAPEAPAARAVTEVAAIGGDSEDQAGGPLASEASVAALVEQLTAGVEPLSGTGDVVRPEPLESFDADDDDAMRPEPAALDAPGLKQSLRPRPRPARAASLAAAGTASATMAPTEDAGLDVDPASLPAGTLMAQLGAFDSPQVARSEWDRFQARFSVYLEGKQRVIQEARSGGHTFYRLRALGFDDMSDARRFCSALVAERAECIPVVLR